MNPTSFVLVLLLASAAFKTTAQEATAQSVIVDLSGVDVEPNSELLVVSSGSMEPTLLCRSFVLSVPITSASTYLRRGAVVSFDVTSSYPDGPYTQTPGKPKFTFFMRIVGLPNDKVELRRGELRINGVSVAEPYASIVGPSIVVRQTLPAMVVPADSVFVLGDSRENSNDSRFSGPVPITFIRGVVKFVSENPPGSGRVDKWHSVK